VSLQNSTVRKAIAVMPKFNLAAYGCGLLVVTSVVLNGCAPIPLDKKGVKTVWSKTNEVGKVVEKIEARSKEAYLPLLFSPEGPGKWTYGDIHVSYYLVNHAENKTQRLGFLDVKADERHIGSELWQWFKAIDERPDWIAVRVIDIKSETNAVADIALFDCKSLKHKRTISFQCSRFGLWTKDEGLWKFLEFDSSSKSLTYKSTDGFHRYKILEDVDALVETNFLKQ
jgi:hypothetical protein